jgi:hypothetical protein
MHIPALHVGLHLPYAASMALSLGINPQVDRLKKLMVHAIERDERGSFLCWIRLHSMAWKPQLQIGRKAGPPWSRYQLHYFQLGFCRRCGRAKQRWIGPAANPVDTVQGSAQREKSEERRSATE